MLARPEGLLLPKMAAAITTPRCVLYAASLVWPVAGWFLMSATFDQTDASSVTKLLLNAMTSEFGATGRRAALPLTDLEDGRWLLRFASRRRPRILNAEGLELIVQPSAGSMIRVETRLQPMRSCVGIIPIMEQIVVLQLEPAAAASNRGMVG